MSYGNQAYQPQDHLPSARLAHDELRIPVERLVSEYVGRRWAAADVRDLHELACHPSAILSDGCYSVFAKFSDATDGRHQFETELAGLRLLSSRSGVMTPTPIGIVAVDGGNILVLEAVQAVDRAPRHWRQIGQALARIHRVKGDRFGLETPGCFGPLHQDNTPASDWPTFYGERRLLSGLRLAVNSGNMPPAMIAQVETLIGRLPKLCGPEVVPSLLHGDAQQNNWISTDAGAVVIDPAVYYGHPEMDLAYVDYFQAVPDDLFDGYREEMAIDPGFWERRSLWRIWGYLAAVTVGGADHLDRLIEAVHKYV